MDRNGGALPRELTRQERKSIRKLVTEMCANYDSGYILCLPLDCPCYMLGKCWTGSLCRYFQNAVLPLDPVLEAALTGGNAENARLCDSCGKPIFAANNRAKFCALCAEAARLKRQREYMRKKRGGY